jgi:hypothetical protein
VSPLQGLDHSVVVNQGRCPGYYISRRWRED